MKKMMMCMMTTLLLASQSFAVTVTTIEQLDGLAAFSFSLQSDNKGYDNTHAPEVGGIRSERMESWIKNNDEFCIGVGDHIFASRDRWINQMQNDPFFHNHYYPILGDHDNETKYFYGVNGTQDQWGRGWVIFKALNNFFNRPDVQFRPKQAAKINNNGKLVDDQLCDYYAVREHSGFKIHIIATHYGDASVFANRTKEWMMQKLNALGAVKTDRDIIIVLVHCSGNFFRDVVKPVSVEDGFAPMSSAEMDTLMMTADLICDASDHIFRRHHERDGMYDGTEALWINTGALDTGACAGYVNIHVLDNPPRFTMQYIDVETKSTRMLHVGNSLKIAADNPAVPYRYAYMKQVNGPIQKIDWNNFPINAVTLTNGATFVSQVVPTSMVAGKTTNVTVRMKNSGTTAWKIADGHKLGSQNAQGNTTWGFNRVDLPSGVTVAAGQEYSFSFDITAPATAGTYNFQWKMVDDVMPNQDWFGALSANKAITVTAPPPVNKAPYFTSNPFSMADATTGVAYNQSLSAKAVDPEAGTKTFSKVAGPTWLSITAAGSAQGTPGNADAGTNSFSVKVIDNQGASATATMTIKVIAATTTVPWVTNMTEAAAGTAITNAGLVVSAVSREYHATIAAGKIFSQTPGGNTSVARGTSVALAVSLGQPPPVVPSVGSIITLKAVNGKYVSATYSTNNTLIANKTNNLTNYERFKVVNATNCIALQCMGNNKFVSIETPSGSKPMLANRATIGSYEKFKLIESAGQIAICSALTTNYASAVSNGVAPLQASQTYVGSYEKFTWKVE